MNRYRLIYTLLLTALMASTNASAGVTIKGNVYGGGNLADVKTNTTVNMGGGTVAGNVYGGGNLGDVGTHADQDPVSVGNYDWKDQDGNTITNTTAAAKMTGVSKVTITGGTVGVENSAKPKEQGNVFGGGKGAATTFECEKGMVYKTSVSIQKSGTTNTLVYRNVYGGGEVSRVENDTEVTIGTASGTDEPNIKGSVFAAGAGVETHGYSALVRGHSTVTVQGKATVEHNVYGGGELASVGRYKVKTPANASDTDVPATLPYGMPAHLINGGKNTVTITDNAVIGTEGDNTTGHVYGAGKGLEPREYDYASQTEGDTEYDIDNHQPKRMVSGNTWEHFANVAAYLQFVETLALTAETEVTITGSAGVIGSVFGGSESGFVYQDTEVKIQNGTINGNVFGGGRGLESFAEAGRVKGNTTVTMSNGSVAGNVYGGGNLGDVGTIYKDAKDEYGNLTYNYVWRNSDANGNVNDTEHNNTTEYNKPSGSSHDTSKNTGVCNVTINGGTIGTGVTQNSDGTFTKGNVYGAGRGSDITWWCEKAIAYATNVTITAGTVNGTVYGGGQVGRVEDDAKVTIGTPNETGESKPTIIGSVYGAGAGLATHGYSALVRGNAEVTVQGTAQIGGSVYGGGEIASVGKFEVVGGLPTKPKTGGTCIVNIKDNAKIGESGTGHNVYGACKGVTPAYNNTEGDRNRSKSMQLLANAPSDGSLWSHYNNDENSPFIWRYYATEADYLAFLKTLALTSHPHVTIGGTWTTDGTTETITPSGTPTVYGSVYGGGQRGVTLGHVDVNMVGGTVEQDVYGGGALADTNLGNWDVNGYVVATGLAEGALVTGLYTRTEADGKYTYTKITAVDATAESGTTYYRQEATWAHSEGSAYYKTTVDLLGGYIKGDAYGGGLGQRNGFNSKTEDTPAVVWGDINVNLGSSGSTSATSFWTAYDNSGTVEKPVKVVKSGRVFGCNNLLGSPQGNVTVTVWTTVDGYDVENSEVITKTDEEKKNSKTDADHTYRLAAVYGGGNLAPYEATGKKTNVIIYGCSDTSILTVYGGGNAAPVPETDVDIHSCYEIGSAFGGGNGKDKYTTDGGTTWVTNPGANVNGNANTMIYGGTVHEAYGASNEKGTIYGNVVIDVADGYPGETPKCQLDVAKLVGAGKNADVNGDLILVMGCKPDKQIPLVFGGADNANVNGDVELTITSGWFGKVFGGNNENGCIMGHIRLNIEETGSCQVPITIDELYLGGNKAAYSQYGYYFDGTDEDTGKPILKPRTAEMAAITDPSAEGYKPVITTAQYGSEIRRTAPYEAPELNIISCTKIGKVFGGGLGETAIMYADPTVNINMVPGDLAEGIKRSGSANAHDLGEIGGGYSYKDENNETVNVEGGVFGGGNEAAVYGNTTVNIGTATSVKMTSVTDLAGVVLPGRYSGESGNISGIVEGAYIAGNVYGGGNEADVTGNTFVNICAKEETNGSYTSVAFGESASGVTIGGNVFGGGKGKADTFKCEKAMVGTDGAGLNADYADGNTNVVIGNGTINGTVYGGGQIGRVERNTTVTIGIGEETATGTLTSAPEIKGNVFGAGAGEEEHGYAALVRGNPTVTIQGNAKIGKSVYGGGEIASVARYMVAENETEAAEHGVEVGMPYVLQNNAYGHCVVTIGGYAEIGPDNMKMYHSEITDGTDKPDDYGHVFGAGRGVLPKVYTSYGKDENGPKRMVLAADKTTSIWEYFVDEEKYFEFIRTLALATETQVTIGDHAFVKGSVYGGSENGIVQYDTNVTIKDHCQIGQGKEITMRYEDYTGGDLFELTTPPVKSGSGSETVYYDLECASWDYGSDTNADGKKDLFAPYDPNANATGDLDKYPAVGTATAKSTEGGRRIATDGHTYYGNVFGGGSGSVPYFDTTKGVSRYIMSAGWVKGNTNVTISGGHILTNVYGGNEATNVDGTATITMTDGTIGVPRTLQQIVDHPVTCYLFGAGKGDQRVFFNKDTNVKDVVVNLTGGRIYGSVFGGGEDGHVLRDVTMTIGTAATAAVGEEGAEGYQPAVAASGPTIGTWGTSYVDGNVFGGGRGFSGDAYTAGNVAGSVKMEIKGGSILGSIYGGGRLGSVGYGLYDELTDGNPTPGYGEMRDDDKMDDGTDGTSFFTKGRGHIDITISGGTIGNNREYIIPNATNMAAAGIPEEDRDISKWDDDNKYWDTWKEYHKIPKTEFDPTTGRLTHTKGGNVFAGGMGNFNKQDGSTYINDVNWWQLGCVKSTKLTITGGTIKSNVYGGGELGQVVGHHTTTNAADESINASTEIIIQNTNNTIIGTEVKETASEDTPASYTFGSVFGGGYGSLLDEIKVNNGTSDVTSNPKFIAGLVKEDTKIDMQNGWVKASIYGGGEMASVGESTTSGETTTATGSTYVSVSGGTVGIAPIDVSGSKRYFGGAKMGNVYGGGSGHNNTVRSGRILKNTNVTISDGTIYHNVYGGGAYGTVGDFDYDTKDEEVTVNNETVTVNKVSGISGLATTGTGVANVTITGGTIGYDGNENGMVFGSSRGDINEPGARDDHCAWVYDTNVIIGTEGSETGPQIKGTVYGSGENGHTYNNTKVTIHSGTIGIESGMPLLSNGKTCEGAAYPNRGNVYGGGCGTDTYPVTVTEGEGQSAVTKTIQAFNPLAGIVYGTTTVNINGGKVVRNVYGAGAMGSVGKTTWTTTSTTTGDVTTTTKSATTSGGSTTINISGGTIGVSGTVGDGNLFGAARGSKAVVQADRDDLSRVSVTNVNVSGGLVKGNVYGGGELGDVGTIVKNTTSYNYTWVKEDNSGSNVAGNNVPSGSSHDTSKNTGICNVTITGGTIGSATAGTGNVFGGGKGDANTWWCEKAMAFATNVNVREASGSTTKVYGTVYGGGEIGRVEDDTKVIIGTENGSDTPEINGNVFGAGKGLATRGYSALVRGNSIVTVQGSAQVGGNVFGGGEEASLGRFNLVGGLPKSPQSGGSSTVTIQDNASIGSSGTGNHVYGAGQGVAPNFDADNYKNFKSMQLYGNRPKGNKDVENTYWDYYVNDDGITDGNFVWVYYKTKEEYLDFLKTLALASHPTVTIAENATVFGDVYGGGQRGLTLGDVTVNITGGTVKQDVYGGGSLADTNKGNWDDDRYVATTVAAGASVEGLYTITGTDDKGNPIYTLTTANATSDGSTTYYRKGTWAADKYNATTHVTTYKTNVNLTGGTIDGNAYGGGLGQLAKAAVAAQGTEGQEGYVPAQPAMDAVEAKVYGDVLVKLNETTESDNCVIGSLVNANDPVSRNGNIFGCNNLNGSPQAGVTVHIHKTAHNDNEGSVATNKPTKNSGNYELQAVYGGGNLAAYYPDDQTVRETAKANVIIEGCDRTSIATVYGGGNAASVPGTEVLVNGTYEIGRVFGGGNGADDYQIDGKWYDNPGANIGYMSYAYFVKEGDTGYSSTTHGSGTQADPYKVFEYTTTDGTDVDASTKESRIANYGYGPGKAHATINLGTVHEVYGGSNSRGNVRVEARTTLEDINPDNSDCPFDVGDAYGGGRNAPMDGDAVLEIGCINGLGKAYGGASNADVNGNVVLNITNGTYGRVFGGNDLGGNITGSITVNIEETGCRPIIIGELYGGGNEAGYSIYGYKKVTETDESTGETVQVWRPRESSTDSPDGAELSIPDPLPKSPQVNVKSFTSIGTVYGGGYGGPATMVGSPEVNINVFEGKFAETYNNHDNVIGDNARIVGSTVTSVASYPGYGSGYPIPSHAKGAIGAIYNVFGGGNAAAVIGTPHVNIGTLTGEVITLASKKIEDSEGKAPTDEGWIPSYQLATVKGVDIRGNVYGAGNNAPVTGDTEVVIGKNNDVKTYSFTSYNAASDGTAWSSGLAQTTGATETISDKEYAEVVILTNGKYGEYIGKKFYVDPEGSGRLQLFDEDKHATSLYVSIKPFELKTYNFKSYGSASDGTQYSTGTAAPTGNFKTLNSKECMQIVVLTNPGEASWVGKTFYVPIADATRRQLYKADGTAIDVWVEITE